MYVELNWVGWFYRLGERRVGPVTRSKIAGLIAGGQLRRSEQVWKAWNEGDEFRLVPTRAAEALSSLPTYRPGSPSARLWRMIHGYSESLESVN